MMFSIIIHDMKSKNTNVTLFQSSKQVPNLVLPLDIVSPEFGKIYNYFSMNYI